MKLKRAMMLVLSGLMIFVLAACTGNNPTTTATTNDGGSSASASTGDSTANYKDTIKFVMDNELPTMDPHISASLLVRFVTKYVYEGLVEYDSNYEPQPQLAESFESNDDNTKWTFKIRKGVKFQNGDEMTVEDVVASLNRWKSLSATALAIINENESFVAEDDSTVSITLAEPTLLFPYYLADTAQFAAIMPSEVIEASDAETGISEYIGTGSMMVDEWNTAEFIRLTAFEDYCPPSYARSGTAGDKTMATKNLEIYFMSDPSTRLAAALSGDYDIVMSISQDNVSQFEGKTEVELLRGMQVVNLLVFNKKQGICTDVNFRLAVSFALDVNEISMAQYPMQEYVEITSSYFPSSFAVWHNNAADPWYNQKNLEKAKEYLEKSSYNGEVVNLCSNQDNPMNYAATLVISEQLKALGIETNIIATDYATWLTNIVNPELMTMYVSDLNPAAIPNTLRFLSPARTGWTNLPELQDILAQMNKATSIDEAQTLWEEGQTVAGENALVVPLGMAFNLNAVNTNVENYDESGEMGFWDIVITE